MANAHDTARQTLDHALKLPAAQHGFACWSRAWTHLATGFVSAGFAQIDLARTLLTAFPAEWPTTPESPASADVAQHWVKSAQIRFDTTLQTYRKINDDLAASLFAAADSLADAAVAPPATDHKPPAALRPAAAKQTA